MKKPLDIFEFRAHIYCFTNASLVKIVGYCQSTLLEISSCGRLKAIGEKSVFTLLFGPKMASRVARKALLTQQNLAKYKKMIDNYFLYAFNYSFAAGIFNRKQRNFGIRMLAQKHLLRNNFFRIATFYFLDKN